MTDPRVRTSLLHMLEELDDVSRFISGLTGIQFAEDTLVMKAVAMSLINLGELSKGLPDDMKERNSQIPWANIIGLRNRAAHGYRALDSDIMWMIASQELPAIRDAVVRELKNL